MGLNDACLFILGIVSNAFLFIINMLIVSLLAKDYCKGCSIHHSGTVVPGKL